MHDTSEPNAHRSPVTPPAPPTPWWDTETLERERIAKVAGVYTDLAELTVCSTDGCALVLEAATGELELTHTPWCTRSRDWPAELRAQWLAEG
jgi:hypothetical protein